MKNYNLNNIIDDVVKQDLCTGCGACVYQSESSFKMDWNKEGFLVPVGLDGYDGATESINVCPFNPRPAAAVRTEDELGKIFLREAPNFHPKVGKYYNTYAGYSEEYRPTSSSGGLATYILSELLEQKLVDAIITVGEGENNHYEYKLVKRKEDLLATSKTRYYPVTMSQVLNELKCFEGRVAVVGIGCFIKAIRLLQHHNHDLREKIVFTVGIICGGLKSKFFGEFLAEKAGVQHNKFTKPQFRIKDYDSTAGDYSFGCVDNQGNDRQVKMSTVGDMWGTGMFKGNACDYCDDVTTELADISLGDAWIPPYSTDGKGTSVIVTRSALAEKLIYEGLHVKKLKVEELPFDIFLSSQQGSYNHRHKALKFRIKKATKQGFIIPPKRHANEDIPLDFKWVQNQRRAVRKKSLCYWSLKRDAVLFEENMKKPLRRLNRATLIYHYKRAVLNKIK